jgi:phosphatidylethanolamine/phosphatidyl-N-methylethanolamine N-methyltransferase
MPSKPPIHRVYDRIAPVYDSLFKWVFADGRRALERLVAEHRPHLLLEVGIGTGLTLSSYPVDTEVVGVDISLPMLRRARTRSSSLAHSDRRIVHLGQMDGEQLAFRDATFDCVTVMYTLSVVEHPDRFMEEIRRVCKPGGLVLIVNHFKGAGIWRPLESLTARLSRKIGFRSNLCFREHVLQQPWRVLRTGRANLFGLSKIVTIQNAT